MKNEQYFHVPDGALDYLRRKDKKLGAIIERIGDIQRAAEPDLFSALVNSIIGQQIAIKAQQSIWRKLTEAATVVTPAAIAAMPDEQLQSFGLSWRKVAYIKHAAEKIVSGEFDIDALYQIPPQAVTIFLYGFPIFLGGGRGRVA